MRIAIISDIHQTTFWMKVIHQKDDFDKIIFLGDEFDCWDNRWPFQMNNAENIIKFKMSDPEKIDLCWSNHATSYYLDERCSGFQYDRAADIKEFYSKHKDFYNVIYTYDNWIFSHGGVSAKWMKCSGINDLSEINPLFREKPNFFRWVGPDDSGNNPNEGPLWIRPKALLSTFVPKYNQITAHTEGIEPRLVTRNKQILVFCDTYEHNYLTILDTVTNDVKFAVMD